MGSAGAQRTRRLARRGAARAGPDRHPQRTDHLRLYLHSTEDTYAELKIRLNNQVPTPTPTPTNTPTPPPRRPIRRRPPAPPRRRPRPPTRRCRASPPTCPRRRIRSLPRRPFSTSGLPPLPTERRGHSVKVSREEPAAGCLSKTCSCSIQQIVFLNHGSFGACPKAVFDVYQEWQRRLERQPVQFLGMEFAEHMRAAAAALGEYLRG